MINDNNISKGIVLRNMAWKFGERIGGQLVSFFISIILARILMPEDYGLIAMVLVFVNIAEVFVTHGIGQSLIQKKNADEIDFSSIFFLSLILSLFLYTIIFFTAPTIASYYGFDILSSVLRVLGIKLFFSAINTVQNAYIARRMMFKRNFYSSIISNVLSFVIGLFFAIKGYGVWALVAQQITSSLTITIVLWFTVKWRPTLHFSLSRVTKLFSFGWKIQLAGLSTVFANEIRQLLIGKLYTSQDLAFYNRGASFPRIVSDNTIIPISAVIFPVASQYQDDRARLKELARRYVRITSFFVLPLLAGIAASAPSLIDVLLTEKWLPSVPYLQIACFSYAIIIIQIAIQDAINALGRSDIFLYMDIVRKAIGLTILFLVMKQGVMAIALTTFIIGPISVLMVMMVSRKMLGYKYKEHLFDNAPILFSAIVMGGVVYVIGFLDLSSILTLIIQIIVGFVTYFILSKYLRLEGYSFAKEYLIKIKNKINEWNR